MNRRTLLARLAGVCTGAAVPIAIPTARAADPDRIEKTPEEWRKILTPEQFYVLRDEGTERAFTSPLNAEKRKGTFVCAGCALPLFKSETKFESGTGWPSFYAPISGAVGTKVDYKIIVARTEYHCRRCGGHQGHVFDDGPKPTGLRYCNNGIALRFVPA
ncbi:MAG: peptide-methionine (R)-S-oxide reductase MsrB [Burkholderiales bacterium]